ncbi:MAG: (E)-4-hydroxy-3-methylbut-2-enyl-diphosphate synthase [Tenuifilaceae bacterium]|nr:(E)-4-hydroxy-3-methylbut-2-enyl-diphosphate synthase [Tenuifilaceae bacterium]
MDSYKNLNIFNVDGYQRKQTLEIAVGNLPLGKENPIRVQTMTTTNTNDIESSVTQCIKAIGAGAEYVRLTTQGVKEAQSLGIIKNELAKRGYNTPLIADIHFNPAAAMEAAKHAHKIRINPGNFSDKSRTSSFTFTYAEYENDLLRTELRFTELLEVCKQYDTTIRIGVNHGSLSQRIMSRYGDTPIGMAHSAIEFVRICHKHNHQKVVVSMKSSNTRTMVLATRHLVNMMQNEGLYFPLHLGVTEAGEGEDARIKSAVGIASLLVDGIGDTIRVSLTEKPENEIPVAKFLVDIFHQWQNRKPFSIDTIPVNPLEIPNKKTRYTLGIGGDTPPVVMANMQILSEENLSQWGWNYSKQKNQWQATDNAADYIYIDEINPEGIQSSESLPLVGKDSKCKYQLADIANNGKSNQSFLEIDVDNATQKVIDMIKHNPLSVIILKGKSIYSFYSIRNMLFALIAQQIDNPCIISVNIDSTNPSEFQLLASSILGPFFIDGLANGLMLNHSNQIGAKVARDTAFGILQAARVRISKTEFISCPGCGRTLYNLNDTLLVVKKRMAHLKGLKIAVMGCIVNGPGEMADADYGYVGSGLGRVTLYRKQEIIKRNIPEERAVDELVEVIKMFGDWVEAKS